MKKISRAGKRSPSTALVSFNTPIESKLELIRIADEKYPKQLKRGRLSSLMREISDDLIKQNQGALGYAPVKVPMATTNRKISKPA